MKRLRELIGHERSLHEIAQTLHFWAGRQAVYATGALQVTCCDELESECVEAFQRGFAHYVLPSLKFARQAAFHLANLGGRYEWGAVGIAAEHYIGPAPRGGSALFVAKLNAHVALEKEPVRGTEEVPFRLGVRQRYGRDSECCGALDGLLEGGRKPHLDDLHEAFTSEGKDRLTALRDPDRVDPLFRPLYAALVSARLQARKIVLDVQGGAFSGPTFWLILPCVTVNRQERDTEILCGIYTIDDRKGAKKVVYTGLGDDPSAYAVESAHGLFQITDDQIGSERAGRDHRELARQMLERLPATQLAAVQDERLQRLRNDVRQNKHRNHHHAKTLLKIGLPILAQVAPIPAATIAFAQGAAGMHHAFRIHKLAKEMEGTDAARQMLNELHDKIDTLDGEHAEAILELLVNEYSQNPG